MIDKFGKVILTMFGIGYFKYAPGTIASLLTCILFLYLFKIGFNLIVIVFFLPIIIICSAKLIDKLSKKFKKIDAREIVIDEFIGQSIAIIPWYIMAADFILIDNIEGSTEKFIYLVILSFIFFRFFDIVKPFPINLIDRKMKNGWGVILDDIIAGIFSFITTYICLGIYVIYFLKL